MLNTIWAFMIIAGVVWAALHGNIGAVTQGLLDSAADAVSLCVTMLGVVSMWTGILKIGERSGLVDSLARRMEPVLRFLFPRLPADHPARRSIAVNMIANMLGLGWAATPAGLQAMKELAQLEEDRRREENRRWEEDSRRQEKDSRRRENRRQEEDSRRREKCRGAAALTSAPYGAETAGKAGGGGAASRSAAPPGTASREMCTFLIINISSLQLIPVNMIAFRRQYGSAAPAAIVGPAIAATAVSTLAAVLFCRAAGRTRGTED